MIVSASVLGWTWFVAVCAMYVVMFVCVVRAERYDASGDPSLAGSVRRMRFSSAMFALALAFPLLSSVILAGSGDYYYTLLSLWFWAILVAIIGTIAIFAVWVVGMRYQIRELKDLSSRSNLAATAVHE